jgi:outer membrane protein assembly factor BamB
VGASSDRVWVSSPDRGQVIAIDPRTNRVTGRIDVPGRPTGLLASDRAVWVVNDHPVDDRETITNIDPDTGTVRQVVPVHGELAEEVVRTTDGLIWVAACVDHTGSSCTWSSLGIDAHDGTIVVSRDLPIADLPLDSPFDVHAAEGDRVWGSIADNYIGTRPESGTVFELDPRGRVRWTLDVGTFVGDLTYGDGSLWVGEGDGQRIVRIDPGR